MMRVKRDKSCFLLPSSGLRADEEDSEAPFMLIRVNLCTWEPSGLHSGLHYPSRVTFGVVTYGSMETSALVFRSH